MNADQFQAFADPLSEPMVMLTGDGLLVAGNAAMAAQLGVARQELRGRKLVDIVADAPDDVARYLRNCARSRQVVLGTLTFHGRDAELPCRTEGALLHPRNGPCAAVLMLRLVPKHAAVAQFAALNLRVDELGGEIRRRKRAEEDARELAERLRTTLASIGDGVIATDTDSCITSMNAVAESLTGWTIAEAMGRPLDTVFHIAHEATRQPVANPVHRALQERVVVALANHTLLIAKDGSERPIDDSAAPIRCTQGEVVGCVLVFRDVTERRALQRETESRLRAARLLASIVESSSEAILYTSLDGIIQTWNAGAERLFGYPAEQALGRNIALVIPPDRMSEEARIIAAATAGRRIEPYDTVRRRSDGERILVSLTVSPVRDESGQVVGISKIVRDIGALRRAEARGRELTRDAAEADAKFRAFFEQGALFAGIMHTDGTIIEPNRLSLQACGYTKEEVVGKFFWDCPWWNRSPVVMEQIKAAWKQAIAGETYRAEMPYFVADGSERIVDFILLPIKDDSGRVMFLAPTGTDVTDRKQTERKLAEALRFYHSSINALQSHIAVLDENGVILEVNDTWRRFAEDNQFTGFNCGVGVNYVELCETSTGPCADDGTIARGMKDVLGGREAAFEIEYPCHSPTEERWFLMRVSRFKSSGPVRAVVSHELVTKRRQAEEALRQADRRKDEFLATLAHELRNPLAPLQNALQVLQLMKGPATPELVWARDLIARQVQQMTRLLEDLFDVSRISRGKLELKRERVGLAQVVQGAVETSRPLIEQLDHELTVTVPPEPIVLDADPTRLVQVFANLLNNAAKYTDRGGRINLKVERQGGDVVVSVKDNGIGVRADQLRTIFGMFSQVESALSRSQGGLGIGLTLVKRLVEMHGGTVEARSAGIGHGSEFVVRLPIAVETSQSPAPLMSDQQAVEQVPLRILIVDDNRDGAESMAMLMQLMGHEARMAYDGEEAVQSAGEFRPHLALLDIGLPKLNGYDACRRIREQSWGTHMVLVAVTGWGQAEDRRKAEAAGFNLHLVKPVDPQVLVDLLRSLARDTPA